MNSIEFTIYLIFLSTTAGVNIKIDGSIDFGPKSSYELKPVLRNGDAESIKTKHRPIVPTPHMPEVISYMMEKYVPKNEADDYMDHLLIEGIASTNKKIARNIAPYNLMDEVQKINKLQNEAHKSTVHKKVTKAIDVKDNTFVRSRKVKDDLQITEFTKHIYKQSLKVFDAIKEKTTDENMKKEVDFLAQSYEDKFGEFVRKTQDQNIKTRLGRQRVIINTLETSNLILKRLVNYLVGMDKDVLRSEITANVYKNEVNKKMEIEKSHICKKFGICRTHDGFTTFTIEIIKIILLCNETQIKQLSNAFTEVMKYTDFSHVMDMSTEKHFLKGMSDIETYDAALLRAILSIVKNVMVNKNKPIEVVGDFDKRVNKTVGALEMVDALENALPPNEKNRLEWEDIKNSVTEWRDGKRTDIMEITQAYADHVQRGIDSFNLETAKNFEMNLNLILGFL